jgi:hypothetical protein
MLPVSLNCSFLIILFLSIFVLCLVNPMLPVSLNFSFFIILLCFVFVQVPVSNVNCQYLWVVNLWLICFVSLRSVSCVPTVVSVSGLPLRFSITCICFVQLNKQTPLSVWLFTYQNLCLYLEVPLMNYVWIVHYIELLCVSVWEPRYMKIGYRLSATDFIFFSKKYI